MSDQQASAPSLDALADRCKAQGWGYSVQCAPEGVVRRSNGGHKVIGWRCEAEVEDVSGMVIAIDGAATGPEALEEAVAGMDRWARRLASGGGLGDEH